MDPNETTELLKDAKGGDRRAFDRLIATYEPRIDALVASRLGERLKGRIDVEDIKQETLLRAFRSIERFQRRGRESFARWLGGIAEHVILYQKERLERRVHLSLDRDVVGREIPASKGLRREERLERLEAAIEALDPDHRAVILLARIDNLPSAEIARRMNRSPAAVAQLLSRALKRLRERFGDTESLSLPDRGLEEGGPRDQPS